MCRLLAFGLAILLLPLFASVAVADVNLKTSDIMVKSEDEEIKAFLAEPEGNGPFPAIVVIQEWWGLTDWIKDNAKRLAAQGYVCLAPDLYRGKVAETPQLAGQLARGLPQDRALRDLKASVDALSDKGNVQKDKIGSIGWCMGGGFSLQLALHDSRVKACGICYGRLVTQADMLKPLEATVLGIFGEEDRGIPPAMVHKFEDAMKEAGKQIYAVKIYQAGHGFMRPGEMNPAYRQEAAKDAWKQIDAFFAKTLAAK
jgi:carboxymethylenebutenolidase